MKVKFLFVSILGILIASLAFSQQPTSRQDLEKRRQQLMEEIRSTQALLKETQQNKKASLSQLNGLRSKLEARQKLINNINQEISLLDRNIQTASGEVRNLQDNLVVLRRQYAEMVRYAYKNRTSYDMLMFLFEAKNFNDALRRYTYMKQYREFRKNQAQRILGTQVELNQKIGVLNKEKSEKDMMLSTQNQQKQELEVEKKEKDKVYTEIRGQEKDLLADINQKKKASANLDKAISRIIQREIELARKKAEEERKRREDEQRRQREGLANTKPSNLTATKPTTTTSTTTKPGTATTTTTPAKPTAPKTYNLDLTPEAAELSSNFEANRGRLPWPVERGTIVGSFGTQKHPVFENITIDNYGIDIRANSGSVVRAVYDGEVSSIMATPGSEGQTVIISHGSYYSVYTNLARVTTSRGAKVSTKQSIGTVGVNDDGEPVINFQIWKSSGKGSSKLNPASWIAH